MASDLTFPETEEPELTFPEAEAVSLTFPETEAEPQQDPLIGKPQPLKPVTPGADAMDAATGRMAELTETPNLDKALAPDPASEKTLLGRAGNVVKSGGRFLRDIGKGILMAPVAGAKAATDLYREATKGGKYTLDPWETAKGAVKEAAETVGDSLIEKYAKKYQEQAVQGKKPSWTKAIGDVVYEDPIGATVDATALKGVMAKAMKTTGRGLQAAGAAKAAKAAAAVGLDEILPIGKSLVKDSAKGLNRLQRAGGAIQEAAGKLDTVGTRAIEGATEAVQKGVFKAGKATNQPWLQALGVEDPAARKIMLQLKGEELSKVPINIADDEIALVKPLQGLTPEVRKAIAEYHRLGDGASPEAIAAVKGSPEALKAFNDYRKYLAAQREEFMLTEGLTNEAVLENRARAQYAVAKYGDMSDDALTLAKADIDKMAVKPVYVKTRMEGIEGRSIDDVLALPSAKRSTGVSFLEKFKGKNPFIEDPIEYIPQVIKEFRTKEGNIRWVKRLQEHPDFYKAVSAKEASAAGEVIPTQGISKKYFEDKSASRAKSLFTRQLVNEKGDVGRLAIAHDPQFVERVKEITHIIPQDTPAGRQVNRMLKMEFTSASGWHGEILRGWDAFNNFFKTAAIKYNPHYYSGNAVGDAVLSLVAGVTPAHLRLGDKLKAFAPSQATRAANVNKVDSLNAFDRLLQQADYKTGGKLGAAYSWLNDVDAAFKRGFITKELHAHIKGLGLKGDAAIAEMRRVLQSVDKLSGAEVARGAAYEAVVKGRLGMEDTPIPPLKLKRIQEIKAGLESLKRTSPERYAARLSELKGLEAEVAAAAPSAKAFKYAASRAKAIDSNIAGLRQDAEILRPMIAKAEQFAASYNNLGPVEQYVFRRIFPFYAFNKAMTGLSYKIASVAPESALFWNRFGEQMEKQAQEDSRASQYRGYGPTGKKDQIASMENLSPFGGTQSSRFVDVPIPGFIDPQQNPLIGAIYGGSGGKTKYSTPYGGQEIPGRHGKSYEQNPDGSLKEVIKQATVGETVGRLAPLAAQLEKYIKPGGGTFSPERGQKNPRSLLDTIGNALGLKTVSKTKGEHHLSKAMEFKGGLDALKAEIRRLAILSNTQSATPETRAKAKQDKEILLQQLKKFVKVRKVTQD